MLGFFSKGSERSVKVKRNIGLSLILKFSNSLVSFLFVPITIGFLDPERFGIWITISAIFNWIGYFDLGIANGLRNKLTEALTDNSLSHAKTLVSTAYFMVFALVALLALVYFVINLFYDVTSFLGIEGQNKNEISLLFNVSLSLFLILFFLKLIKDIDLAHHSSAKTLMYDLIAGLISILTILLLKKYTEPSLLKLGISMMLAPILVYLVASVISFNGKYKYIRPVIQKIDLKVTKEIFGLGIKVLFIQLAIAVIFTTDSVIIAKLVGVDQVASYAIANKYFGILSMVFGIIVMPYWNAFTEAYRKGEVKWIKNVVKKLMYIWIGLMCFALLMYFCANKFYYYWVGAEIQVTNKLNFIMLVFFAVTTWNQIFSTFLFGIGKLNKYLIFSILGAVINIPLAVLFCKYYENSSFSVVLASIMAILPLIFVLPMEYINLIKTKKNE